MIQPDVKITTTVSCTATIGLSEGHLRALAALTGYGIDAFLKVFYEKLGASYMKPHEADMRSLFKHIDANVPHALIGITNARKELGIK